MTAATLHIASPISFAAIDFAGVLPSRAAVAATVHTARNIGLFLAAPFIGLVYAMALPLVGLAMLLWMGAKALVQAPATHRALIGAKNTALIAAAPLIGPVYAVLLPLVGIAMIARIGYQAYRTPKLAA